MVFLDYPSPGRPNQIDDPQAVRLNEVLIGSTGWVELTADAAVDLASWRVRTVSHSPQNWDFPEAASISAGGFLVVSFDQSPGEHGDHAGDLPIDDTYEHWGLELINAAGQVIDRVTWGHQITGQSIGRLADDSWALLAAPSAREANGEAAALGEVANLTINEWFAASGATLARRQFPRDPQPDGAAHRPGRPLVRR